MGVGSAATPTQLQKLQIPQNLENGFASYVGFPSFYNETSSDFATYVGTSASHNQPHCQNFTIRANNDVLNIRPVKECVSTYTSRKRKADEVQKVVPSQTKNSQGCPQTIFKNTPRKRQLNQLQQVTDNNHHKSNGCQKK